jgi:hypothetical protein
MGYLEHSVFIHRLVKNLRFGDMLRIAERKEVLCHRYHVVNLGSDWNWNHNDFLVRKKDFQRSVENRCHC